MFKSTLVLFAANLINLNAGNPETKDSDIKILNTGYTEVGRKEIHSQRLFDTKVKETQILVKSGAPIQLFKLAENGTDLIPLVMNEKMSTVKQDLAQQEALKNEIKTVEDLPIFDPSQEDITSLGLSLKTDLELAQEGNDLSGLYLPPGMSL